MATMTDSPMTATALMQRSFEEDRIAARDRAVVLSVARKAFDENFDAARIEDMRDVREQMTRMAEQAAYEAILKERELHAHDMAMLKAWMEVRAAEDMLEPRVFSTIPVDIPRAHDKPQSQ